MLPTLIPAALGLITSASTSIALDSAVKIITPPTVKALTGFGIKAGTLILGGLIAAKMSDVVSKKTTEIIEIVQETPAEPVQDES